MAKSYWKDIAQNYEQYLERYPEEGIVTVGGAEFPFQHAVKSGGFIGYNEGSLERECLISYSNEIPGVTKLPIEDLARLPVWLTRTLKVQVTPDHDRVWEEAHWVLKEINHDNKPIHDGLVHNVEALFHAVMVDKAFPQQRGRSEGRSQDSVLENAAIYARYMAFPTLEGIVKSLCRRDIRMDGTIRRGRIVLRYDEVDHYPGGSECSHLGHLLWHLEQDVAEDPLRQRLRDYRSAYADFFQSISMDQVYGDIHANRNDALHGATRVRAEFGMLLNLISLIIFNIDWIPVNRRTIP